MARYLSRHQNSQPLPLSDRIIPRAEFVVSVSDDAIVLETTSRMPDTDLALQRSLEISFQKVIDNPRGSNVSEASPELSRFPVYKIKDYAHRFPEDLAKNGGLFFHMDRKLTVLSDGVESQSRLTEPLLNVMVD